MVFLAPEMLLHSPPDIMYLRPPTMIITTETKPTTMEKMLMTSVRILLSLSSFSAHAVVDVVLTDKPAPWQSEPSILPAAAYTETGAKAGKAKNINTDKLVINLLSSFFISY